MEDRMEKNQKREYQTTHLSALLHDIGTFYLLSEGKRPEETEALKNDSFQNHFLKSLSILLSKEESETVLSYICKQRQTDTSDFVSIARQLSLGFDNDESLNNKECDPCSERLLSVFQQISLGNHSPSNAFTHRLAQFSTERDDIFPHENQKSESSINRYKSLWDKFENEIDGLPTNKLSTYITALYYLLLKYTWCVPSAIGAKGQDISLFDHLKTTAAIAGCLAVKKMSNETDNEEFLILGGDVSGIQSFIYKITNVQGAGGISKRLRGRSFYLVMLQEVIVQYLLRSFSIEIPHILYSGGGRFNLLLPNTKDTRENIKKLSSQINKWLLDKFDGELGLVFASKRAGTNDLKDYSGLLNDIDDKLAVAKKEKYKEFFENGYFWLERAVSNEDIRICRSCNTKSVPKGENNEICSLCEEHKKIGSNLPQNKLSYIAFLSQPNDIVQGTRILFNEFGCIYLLSNKQYLETYKELPETLNIYKINETSGIFKLIGNTVPVATETFSIGEDSDDEDKTVKEKNVLSFEIMANASIGDKRLGVLKMDIDHLGLLFSVGTEVDCSGKKSMSRLATLSRSIDLFFAGYLDVICKKAFLQWKEDSDNSWPHKEKVTQIFYTVYSGGDDLMITGPWSEIPNLAREIRREFKEYTCGNKDIDISAGIFLCKPKYPVSLAAKAASEELEKSKNGKTDQLEGRKCITLFGDTVKWQNNDRVNLDELFEFGEYLYRNIMNEDSRLRLPRGFVHGLLRIHKQYTEGQNLNFIPAVLYQLTRNIKDKAIRDELKRQLITCANKEVFFKHIRIPASYTLLKSRKGE
jgi:CRISPR-associated protein Csm1